MPELMEFTAWNAEYIKPGKDVHAIEDFGPGKDTKALCGEEFGGLHPADSKYAIVLAWTRPGTELFPDRERINCQECKEWMHA